MKKHFIIFISIIMIMTTIFGCSSSNIENKQKDDNKIKIITTIFPIYDYVKNILGDKFKDVEVSVLLDDSLDLHNYQPTTADIVKISECDLFLYVGGESDEWVPSVLEQVKNENLLSISLMDLLAENLLLEEEKEGMDLSEGQGEEEHIDEMEHDEHVWLSLQNAKKMVLAISNAIKFLDTDNISLYEENTNKYIEKLDALDSQYRDMVNSSKNKMLIFGDRFPFLYLTKDYGLDYYAAFKGCSAETEASFETIAFLSKKLDEYNLDFVMTIDNPHYKIAETIIANSNNKDRKILSLNSMQSITQNDIKNGASYIDIMTKNMDILKQALN